MTIDDIHQSFDALTTNIQSFIDWADSVEKQDKLLVELDFKLRDRETIINKKVDDLSLRENKLKSDSLVVDSKINEMEQTKAQIQSIDNKLEVLGRKEKEIADKQTNLDTREAQIKEKEKELEGLKEVRKELDHRETLLKKEMLMDKIRQEKLDAREQELNKEKDRLQQIASRIGAKLVI